MMEWISMRICSDTRAYTLPELAIAITVFSILFTAVLLLFSNQKEAAEDNMDHNINETDMRLALDEIEDYVQNAGLAAYDTGEDRHAILYADSSAMTFIADIDKRGTSGPEDILTLCRDEQNTFVVMDATDRIVYQGQVQGMMTFRYFDSRGDEIPGSELDRIRQIEFTIEIERGEGAMQSRVCTPPNLSLSL